MTTLAVPTSIDPVSPSSAYIRRSMYSIIWSCSTTVITFIWVTVRPNVPPPGWKQMFLRRLQMTFWYLVAPELVLAWAVRQWLAARLIAKTYQDRGWTMTHGFFLVMGGFTLVDPRVMLEKPLQPSWFSSTEYEMQRRQYSLGTLSFDRFRVLADERRIDFPRITAEEIQDRSKGNFIVNMLAVLQFASLCMVRSVQGLALTELELVTLALTSLNVVTLMFMWHKPQGVQEPFKIYLKTEDDQVPVKSEIGLKSLNPEDVSVKDVWDRVVKTLERLLGFIRQPRSVFDWFLLPIILFLVFSTAVLCPFPLAIASLLSIIRPWTRPAIDQGASSGDRDHRRRSIIILHNIHHNVDFFFNNN